MKRNSIQTLLILLPWILLASCMKDDAMIGTPENEASTITFSLKLPAAGATTRSLSDTHEEEVRTIDVYVFDAAGELVDFGYGHSLADASSGTDIIKTFRVNLQPGTGREVMVIVNAGKAVENAYPSGLALDGSVVKSDFIDKVTIGYQGTAGWNTDPTSAGYLTIPMWGVKKNVDIENDDLTGPNGIKLSRMLAKVSLGLDSSILPAEFELNTVSVYNYNHIGRLIPDDGNGNDWTAVAPYAVTPSLPSTPDIRKGPISYTTMTDPGRSLTGTIYLFESEEGSRTKFEENTCLVIGGEYGGVQNYYRIDFARNTGGTVKYLPILRNHHYMVTVKSISGPGFENEEDALNSLPVNIEAYVIPWNDANMDGVEFDGQNYLSVSPVQAHLWKAAAIGNKIEIETSLDEWTYEVTDSDEQGGTAVSWLTVTSDTHNGAFTTDLLTFDVDENNDGDTRTAYIHINAGRLTVVVIVTQYVWEIISIEVEPSGIIPMKGQTRNVIITGNFDDIKVRAHHYMLGVTIDDNTVAGSTTSSWSPLVIDAITSGTRTVTFEYLSPDGEWIMIRSDEQAPIKLSSGRIVAEDDAPTLALTWAEAMGIVTDYNTAYFYTTYGNDNNNRHYVATEITGCGAYAEDDYPAGTWRLPTSNELSEIYNYSASIGVVETADYWSSAEPDRNYGYRVTMSTGSLRFGEKINSYYARCVREDMTVIYNVTSNLAKGAAIDGYGESFTVTANGFFPHLPVRAWDDTNNLALAQGILTGHFGSGSIDVKIPDNTTLTARQIILQYSPDNGLTWKDISYGTQDIGSITLPQTGRVVAKDDTDEYGNPVSAGTVSMDWAQAMGIELDYNTAQFYHTYGTDSHNREYKVSEMTGCGVYSEEDYPPGTWRLPTQDELNVLPPYRAKLGLATDQYWSSSEGGHLLAGLYSMVGNGSVSTRTKITTGYIRCVREDDIVDYTVTSDLAQNGTILGSGEEFTITATGYFPHLPIRVYDDTHGTVENTEILYGHYGTNTVQIKVHRNQTGEDRKIILQYSPDGGINWEDITSGNQQDAVVILPSGRIVAAEDLPGILNWSSAMGINASIYNNGFFYTTYTGGMIDNEGYTPEEETGCGSYSEPRYPAGSWFLPTLEEMKDMARMKNAIGNIYPVYYWTSTENTLTTAYYYSMAGNGGFHNQNKTTSSQVRCVREP